MQLGAVVIRVCLFASFVSSTSTHAEIWQKKYSNGHYEGELKNGMRDGFGVMEWDTGARYEGEFVLDKRTGSGSYTWPCGNRYEGEFKDGKLNGQGTTVWYD